MKKKKMNTEIASYHIMLLPGVLFLLVFSTIPLFGLVMAFQRYVPAKGFLYSQWVGLQNFMMLSKIPDIYQVIFNTVYIALIKIILGIVVPVVFALMLNEVRNRLFKRSIQTIVYLPYFLSWVILGGIFTNMLSTSGVVNLIVEMFGGEATMFLGSNNWFRPILFITDTWKNFGYGAVIYLAALTAIDANLYEAAAIDGANRFQQLIHVTLPGIVPTIILMSTLSLGNVLNAGFDQIFNMYNNLVYQSADIIDTYIYRMGLVDMQFSLGTAVGLFKSIISLILISASYFLAGRFAGYRIF